MRKAVQIICLGYVLLFAGLWLSTYSNTSMDNMSRQMSLGFITVGALVAAIFGIPAFILASLDKLLKLALVLALLPVAAALVFAGMGG